MTMSLYRHSQPITSASKLPVGITEFEILKSSHKFLREDDDDGRPSTWNDQLAAKYYANLYREFALCDLKHYKSGNFALRWRTEDEVLSGAGETTCGNTRCEHHHARSPSGSSSRLLSIKDSDFDHDHGARPNSVPVTTLELPFAYIEQGESKSALVKVVLCGKCLKKLLWKRRKDSERGEDVSAREVGESEGGDKSSLRERGLLKEDQASDKDREREPKLQRKKRSGEEDERREMPSKKKRRHSRSRDYRCRKES